MIYEAKINNFYDIRQKHKEKGLYKLNSISGIGSSISNTQNTIRNLNLIITKYEIKTILDAPCGDFEWMKNVDLRKVNYLGLDIVKNIIQNNKILYENNNIKFEVVNLFDYFIHKNYDLIICRDFFFHLNDELIIKLLQKFKIAKYLLVTTHDCDNLPIKPNFNIGLSFRRINLKKSPFNLKNIEYSFEEPSNRSMCLFKNINGEF